MAFQSAENLTRIDLSAATLTEIGFNVFAGCSNATLTVAFDDRGYHAADGAQCELGNHWNQGVQGVIYGEKYCFFEPTFTGIRDGMKVSTATLTFTAAVTYGDETCALTVRNDTTGATATAGSDDTYTVELQAGANTVTVVATSHDASKNETFAFSVNYVDVTPKFSLRFPQELGDVMPESGTDITNLKKCGDDDLVFTLQVTAGDDTLELDTTALKFYVDCGMSSGWTGLQANHANNYSIVFSDDKKTATVTLHLQGLEDYWYEVYDPFHLKITFSVTGASIEVIYYLQHA